MKFARQEVVRFPSSATYLVTTRGTGTQVNMVQVPYARYQWYKVQTVKNRG
jgi:hypothetical protein